MTLNPVLRIDTQMIEAITAHENISREEARQRARDALGQVGIPAPDELVLVSWFEGGEVFRSGCTWHRGRGRIFYFRPGHETYPIYHDPVVQQVQGVAGHGQEVEEFGQESLGRSFAGVVGLSVKGARQEKAEQDGQGTHSQMVGGP